MSEQERQSDLCLAVVGMAGRFPGANSLDELWGNLKAGDVALTDTQSSSASTGVDGGEGHYVPRAFQLEGIDRFDASYFGYSPSEARKMDPQQRLLLETAHHALESAGVVASNNVGRISVFASSSINTYLLNNLHSGLDERLTTSNIQTFLANDKDFLATRIAYKLNLRGPAMTVQTACSSSLVGVHLACQSLLNYECDAALAGGVSILLPQDGHVYQEGMIYSPDGQIRPFDAQANGTVFGRGAGMVVLRRLEDAIQDGDEIHAIIRGSAINNDGSFKAGYTAPSIDGQAEVIAEAHAAAGLTPDTIGYVEAHGTGTPQGDPIEIAALNQAFAAGAERKFPCAIGTIKPNIGHLDAAAGIAGLIKCVLILKHGQLPPTPNYDTPNPLIDFNSGPFFVNTELRVWPDDVGPLRCGVSSFGMGGTNAHVVLEAWKNDESVKETQPASGSTAPEAAAPVLCLSAQSQAALGDLAGSYADQIEADTETDLADIAYSAMTRRNPMNVRMSVAGDDPDEIAARLRRFAKGDAQPESVVSAEANEIAPRITFLFSGQGAQRAGVGRRMYDRSPVFREAIQACDQLVGNQLGEPLREVLFANPASPQGKLIDETRYTQPCLFALQYAMWRQWSAWGVEPDVLIGHSFGEYTAAVAGGVMTMPDAMRLLLVRAQAMDAVDRPGAMAAVFTEAHRIEKMLEDQDGALVIAAYNGPACVTISGDSDHLQRFTSKLDAEGIMYKRLAVSRAFHSSHMQAASEEVVRVAASIPFKPSTVPIACNVNGELTSTELSRPGYWAKQILTPVHFTQGVQAARAAGTSCWLEVGPGETLTGLVRYEFAGDDSQFSIASLKRDHPDEWQSLALALGELISRGYVPDAEKLYNGQNRTIVGLPLYPFQREPYWVEPTDMIDAGSLCDSVRERAEALYASGRLTQADLDSARRLAEVMADENIGDVDSSPGHDWYYRVEWRQDPSRGADCRTAEFVPSVDRINDHLAHIEPGVRNAERLGEYRRMVPDLDELSEAQIVNTLDTIGLPLEVGSVFSVEGAANQYAVIEKFKPLWRLMCDFLVRRNLLELQAENVKVIRDPVRLDIAHRVTELLDRHEFLQPQLALSLSCSEGLAGSLLGKIDPLSLIFSQGAVDAAERLYTQAPYCRYYNTLLRSAVVKAVEALPEDRPIRVLEIGAGTGGTSRWVMEALPPDRASYTYTDVSPAFIQRAQDAFRHHEFIQYDVLDINRCPFDQGYERGKYDLVVAANVLHATADIKATLGRVNELLSPGGMLLAIEGTSPNMWVDLIFGLTDGWWCFDDNEFRDGYVLISPSKWSEVLRDTGFEDSACFPDPNTEAGDGWQCLVTARKSVQPDEEPPKPQPSTFAIYPQSDPLARTLGEQLIQSGMRVVYPDDISKSGHQSIVGLLSSETSDTDGSVQWVYLATAGNDLDRTELCEQEMIGQGNNLLGLAQLINASDSASSVGLWVVTRGGAAKPGIHYSPSASGLWGMSRVLSLELSDQWRRVIDLDSDMSDQAAVEQLLAEFRRTDDEGQIFLSETTGHVPRLVRSPMPDNAPMPVRADRSYLITGGLGRWGIKLARWLVEHGARHLILTSRSGLADESQWDTLPADTDLAHAVLEIRSMREQKVQVSAVAVDVADREAMSGVLATCGQDMPLLAGVIHAAATTLPTPLDETDPSHMSSAIRSKAVGGLVLHHLTREMNLDWLCLFSSGVSIWGGTDLIHQACAAHALDGLALHIASESQTPVICINWGWLAGGRTTDVPEAEHSYQNVGLLCMPEQGVLMALERAYASGNTQQVIAGIDWDRFKPIYEARKAKPFISEVTLPQESGPPGDGCDGLLGGGLSGTDALIAIDGVIAGIAAEVLGIDDPSSIPRDRGLFDLGIDSLMTIDFRVRLGKAYDLKLPATIVFDYPTVAQLTEYLADRLGVSIDSSGVAGDDGDPASQDNTDVLSALDQEISSLEAMLDESPEGNQ